MYYSLKDTIAAVATPPGEGGVAIIRISGDKAVDAAGQIYSGPIHTYQTHALHYGKILKNQRVIDEVLIVFMKSPKSYTGEDTVEIHSHGGNLIPRLILESVIQTGKVRAALPGEFTFRAYMNGKIDLSQAEAVQALIGAKNSLALQTAENQLEGALSKKIVEFQQRLLDIVATIEASLDFPEEGLQFASLSTIIASMESLEKELLYLSETFLNGKLLFSGISLCLIGTPNVGKSSLMNALLKKNRAIVTDIAGTTRDVLEEDLTIGGLHFRLMDTAGIRKTTSIVEKEGVRRSYEALNKADVVLLVLDSTRGIDEEDKFLMDVVSKRKNIILWNKIDLPTFYEKPNDALAISAEKGTGLDILYQMLNEKIWGKSFPNKEEILITNIRHKEALDKTILSLQLAIQGLKNKNLSELVVEDIKQALRELGEIVGTDISEEILTSIFSKFCIGK
jgi:tRNA modification GTPase